MYLDYADATDLEIIIGGLLRLARPKNKTEVREFIEELDDIVCNALATYVAGSPELMKEYWDETGLC